MPKSLTLKTVSVMEWDVLDQAEAVAGGTMAVLVVRFFEEFGFFVA